LEEQEISASSARLCDEFFLFGSGSSGLGFTAESRPDREGHKTKIRPHEFGGLVDKNQ
jgi:hypothetical protein